MSGFQETFGKGKRMAPFMNNGVSAKWRKKTCARCERPFHKAKRPKGAVAVQVHRGSGLVTDDRYLCVDCTKAVEHEQDRGSFPK